MDPKILRAVKGYLSLAANQYSNNVIADLIRSDGATNPRILEQILYQACAYGDFQLVGLLVALGVNVNCRMGSVADIGCAERSNLNFECTCLIVRGARTPFMVSVFKRDFRSIEIILASSADDGTSHCDISTIEFLIHNANSMHEKCSKNFLLCLDLLLKQLPAETINTLSRLLYDLVAEDSIEAANLLFKYGANNLCSDSAKGHLLFHAQTERAISWMLSKGVSIAERGPLGMTLLHWHILKKSENDLIRKISNVLKSTPISDLAACKLPNGYPRLGHLAVDYEGRSVLQLAVESENLKLVEIILGLPLVRELQLDLEDLNGWSPLMIAADSRNLELFKLLLDSFNSKKSRSKPIKRTLKKIAEMQLLIPPISTDVEGIASLISQSQIL